MTSLDGDCVVPGFDGRRRRRGMLLLLHVLRLLVDHFFADRAQTGHQLNAMERRLHLQ